MKTETDDLSQKTVEPLLSVVMAARNESRHIATAIESIVSQTYPNWELIVIDDGSIDDTPDILESYSRKDGRIRWVRNLRSQGLAVCLNQGIRSARGAIIVRTDADDLNLPTRFEDQLSYLNAHPHVDILGTGAYLMDENGNVLGNYFLPENHDDIVLMSFRNTCFLHPSVAMRRDAIIKMGPYDQSYKRAQDKELWLRGISLGLRYANIRAPLIKYRTSNNKELEKIYHSLVSNLRIGFVYKQKNWVLHSLIHALKEVLVKYRLYTPRSYRKNKVKSDI